MAVTCTLLTSGTAVSTGTTVGTAVVTIPNGKAAAIVVNSVATGAGLTQSLLLPGATNTGFSSSNQFQMDDHQSGLSRTTIFLVTGNGVADNIGFGFGTGTATRVTWHVVYFDGVDVTSLSGMVNYDFGGGTSTTALATLDAPHGSINNPTFFAVGSVSNSVHTPESGWTEIDEQGGSTTGVLRSSIDFLAGNDTTGSATVGNAKWQCIVVELKATGSTSTNATAGNAAGTGTASGEKVTGSTHPLGAAGTGSASTETVLREALPLAGVAGGTGVAGLGASYVDVNAECPTGLGECVDPGISSTGGVGEVLDDPTFSNPSTTQVSMTFAPTPTAGDLLLAIIGWNTVNRTVTSVDGWTKIGADHLNGTVTTYDCALSIWWKRSLGTESGPQRWNASGAAMLMDGQMARYASLSDPVDQSAESSDALSFTKTTLASGTTGTTTAANELLLSAFMLASVKTLAFSNSFLELATVDRLHIATRNVAATGAYSTTATWTGTTDGTAAIITVSGQTFVSASAGNAAGTGSAGAQKVTESTHAGNGAGTGSAANGVHAPFLTVAAGVGVANAAKVTGSTSSSAASGTGAANAPTIPAPAVNAGSGSGSGAASGASELVKASASAIPVTGAANAASVQESVVASAATGTGASGVAAGNIVFGAVGIAAATAQAFDGTVSSSSSMAAVPPAATGTGTASNAQVTLTSANAGNAAGSGVASGAADALLATAVPASGSGLAFAGSEPTAAAMADVCTGTGLAASPPLAIEFAPIQALGTGLAFDLVLAPQVTPAAEFADGTGSAFDAGVTVSALLTAFSVANGRALALTR